MRKERKKAMHEQWINGEAGHSPIGRESTSSDDDGKGKSTRKSWTFR